MSGTPDGDEALLSELGEALRRHDRPPGEVVAAAKALFTRRAVEAKLAALTFDSLLDREPAGVRTTTALRVLTFEADGLAVEVEVGPAPVRRLVGQLVPAHAAEIELVSTHGTVRVTADHLGRFVLALPAGPSRSTLRVTIAGERVVTAVAVL